MYLHSVAQRAGVPAPQLYHSQVSFRQQLKLATLKCVIDGQMSGKMKKQYLCMKSKTERLESSCGSWLILHSNLIRDLKVSNLLMTDKGCVKIGKSFSLPQPNHCCSSHSQLSNSIISAPPFTPNTSTGL